MTLPMRPDLPESSPNFHIAALLHEAATLVLHDRQATQVRLDAASALLAAPLAPPLCDGAVKRLLAPWQARRIRAYIEEHLDGTIRIEALASHARLSVSYFCRAFRGTFGAPPHAFIMQCRIDRALGLLIDSDEPVAQIAIACGFSDQAHFSRVFSQKAGMPPSAWRRYQRGGISFSA